jgi:hypothetical protein
MPSEDPVGLPELRDVIGRLSGRAGLDHTPEQIADIARSLYEGVPLSARFAPGDPELDPAQWRALAAIPDWQLDVENKELGLPEMVFGLSPQELRGRMWQNWSGPGWSAEEVDSLGRAPGAFELSPGDQRAHQWLRDQQYLYDVLDRGNVIDQEQIPEEVSAWGGPSSETPASQADTNLKRALYWYERGKGATHSSDPTWLGTWTNWTDPEIATGPVSSNFRRYAEDGMGDAFHNPEYAGTWLNQNVFLPLENALNYQTMRNVQASPPLEEVIGEGLANTNLGQYVIDPVRRGVYEPVRDFFRNALIGASGQDSFDPVQHAINVREGGKYMAHSPVLPSMERGLTPAQRIKIIQDSRKAYQDASNMSGADYHRLRTGQNPSYAGSLGTTVASSAIGDPTIFAAGLLRGAAKGGVGKAVLDEAGQESAENAAFIGLGATMPREDGLSTPHIKNWFDPKARTDLPQETDEEFRARVEREHARREAANRSLGEMRRSTPNPKSYSDYGAGAF